MCEFSLAGFKERGANAHDFVLFSYQPIFKGRERFGDLALELNGRPSIFGAMVLKVDSLDGIRGVLQGLSDKPRTAEMEGGLLVSVPNYDTLLLFRP